MLGQPIYMLLPEVVGFELTGELPPGATATDLVLTVTQILRKHGVVDKFVEFFGAGVSTMSLADRATIANMAPEYGATMGFFPVDDRDAQLPAPHRPHQGRSRARRALQQGAGPVPHRRDAGADVHARRSSSICRRSSRASPARSGRRIASPLADMKQAWRRHSPRSTASVADERLARRPLGRRRRPRRSETAAATRVGRRSGSTACDRMERQAVRAQARRRRHRRDHQLHQHQQPVR